MSKPRPPLPPMPYRTLNDWRFDDPNWWSYPAQAPLLFLNVSPVESWSGYAMSLAGLEPAWLVFPMADDNGEPNLNPTAGTVQFWFNPYWSSAAAGGKGPGRPAVLFELGAWSEKSATGWWSLEVAPDGNSVALVAVGSVESAEVLRAPLAWQAGVWHQVTLNYSAKSTELYLDGALAAAGPGVALIPLSPSPGKPGFALGSAAFGGHSALGEFDELSTFIEPRQAADIAAHYNMLKDRVALGPITPQEEARLLALAEAAGRGAERQSTIPRGLEPCLGSCEQLTVCIDLLDPAHNRNLVLRACGREPGVTYSWWSTPDLPTPPTWDAWEWTADMRPEDTELVFLDPPGPRLFFQLVESPHFYVSATAAANGDGSQDLPFNSLRAALDSEAVSDGAVILVAPGVYNGSNNRDLTFGNKDVALIAERGWESTIIDCAEVGGNHKAFTCAIASEYTRGLVLGFTITNATQRALECSQGSRPRFANCAFSANSSSGDGGAIYCNNAQPTFLNCRFRGNSAANHGGAIYATGSQSLVRVSHCTFSDNARASGGGTLCAANGARMELTNCIVWSSFGTEIVTSGGGTVVAGYCDIAGTPLYPGTGNLNANPAFEANGTLRLTVNSPCIDRGTTNTFIDCYVLVRHDMDGEARLDHAGFPNTYSTTDIGADEFVYRLPFLLDGNYSQVDEASGVAYLGSIAAGNEQHAKFAVIDDEVRNFLYIYELDAAGLLIPANTIAVNIAHPNPPTVWDPGNCGGADPPALCNDELNDLEGITFDSDNGFLYIITSQTKRNRYRDVDHGASDPVFDPPSNDYDRRRNIIMRIQIDVQGQNPTFNPLPNANTPNRAVWESEHVLVPFNTGYDAVNGLIAFIREQLNTMGAPYTAIDRGNDVLIAWNTVNRFDTPQKGVSYQWGDTILSPGGGTVIGSFALNVNALAVQSDGRILVGGSFYDVNAITQRRIARLHSDGTLDLGFSSGVGPNDQVHALAVQPDGKVVIGGAFTFVDGVTRNRIARLNADGSLDTTFGNGLTGASDIVYAIALQPDGKILIGGAFTSVNGSTRSRVARLNANGTVDTAFANVTVNNNTAVFSLALQSDGKVLMGGDFTSVGGVTRQRVARRNATGTHDTSFGNSAVNATVRSVLQQSDGKVIIGGDFTTVQSTSRNGIARLNSNGTLDSTFGNGLAGANALVRAAVLQGDGRLLIGGDFTTVNTTARNRVARLNSDGTLDTAFGDGLAGADKAVRVLRIQSDSRILLGGDFGLVNGMDRDGIGRLNSDGTLDSAFTPTLGGALTEEQIQNGRVTLVNATPTTWNYFKIWVRDANGNYHDGPVAACFTDGVPRLFINEFFSTGTGTDWVEVYNPADRALNMGNISAQIGQLGFRIRNSANLIPIPANSTIPARGFLRFIRNGTPTAGIEVQLGDAFNILGAADDIFLRNLNETITVDEYRYRRDQVSDVTEGRAWDGGPRGLFFDNDEQLWLSQGARFQTGSPYPPTNLRSVGGPDPNQATPFKHFYATPDPDQNTIYLEWAAIGLTPAVWSHSPKQHDYHPINVEAIAYCNATEMIISLRSPLTVDRKTGNALYFLVNNVAQFLPAGTPWGPGASLPGIVGPRQLNLNNQGIRSMEWSPNGLLNAEGQPVQRYLIIGGPANGGPLEKELFGEKYSLYAWDGTPGPGNIATPQKLIDDLRSYTVRPEGVDLIQVAGEWRVLFVEDRYRATGYGTRNAVHWPVSILGDVQ